MLPAIRRLGPGQNECPGAEVYQQRRGRRSRGSGSLGLAILVFGPGRIVLGKPALPLDISLEMVARDAPPQTAQCRAVPS